MPSPTQDTSDLMALGFLSIGINVILMIVKIVVGLVGNSYALVADGIESAGDIFTSIITWAGFQFSLKPPDDEHPFGHGKAESLAGLCSGLSLLAAALIIAYSSIHEILQPHHAPAWFTLPVLIAVVIIKELLSRKILTAGKAIHSHAIQGDAWHHRSDAITSAAAALGIAIALIGGPAYAMADDCAALFACLIIAHNGVTILRGALHEVLDGSVDPALPQTFITIASQVPGVSAIEKCRIRKSGIGLFIELHVWVPPDMTVFQGHRVSHAVKDTLIAHDHLIRDVVIHLEPARPPA